MNVFFHIGYPRTGSTFIQQNFFEKYNKINYLGPKRYDPSLNLYLTDKKMNEINLLDINNDMNLNNSNKLFGDLKLSEEKINVISSEKFLSFEINYLHNLFKIKELLKLQNKNINFKVFFVIRNQFEIMESYYYRAYAVISKKFKVKNFKELTELPKSNLFNNSQEEKFFNNYRYEKTFKDLNTHFHKRDISVLLYEDLNNNKVKFLKQLALIFNIDPINLIQFLNVERINDLKKKNDKVTVISVFHPKLKYFYDKFQLKRIIPKNIKNILKFFFQKEIEIETKIPESNKKNIKKYFYQSNILFENNSGLKLPKEYFE